MNQHHEWLLMQTALKVNFWGPILQHLNDNLEEVRKKTNTSDYDACFEAFPYESELKKYKKSELLDYITAIHKEIEDSKKLFSTYVKEEIEGTLEYVEYLVSDMPSQLAEHLNRFKEKILSDAGPDLIV